MTVLDVSVTFRLRFNTSTTSPDFGGFHLDELSKNKVEPDSQALRKIGFMFQYVGEC